jgi:molecular chaperone DnaK
MSQIVGIDLGTTNSEVAAIIDGKPTLIPNERGKFITPSIVGFTDTGELLVGEPAKNQAVANPERTVNSIKRLMGTDRRIVIGDKEYSPQEISAVILKKLKLDAETYLGAIVSEAIITVPAYFTDAQRQATKDAGEIAGFKVERIINEPTAAALAYGFDKGGDAKKILVYDLGGGTFDVSIIQLVEGTFKVLATTGNNNLGGDDFDYRLVEHLIERFRDKEKVDLKNIPDVSQQRAILQRLKEAAENAKIDLSSLLETEVNLPFIYTEGDEPLHLHETITRAKYEELVKDLIAQTEQPIRLALSDALDAVILVGGMTRTPLVQRLVREVVGRDPLKDINPEECVALGASIQAGIKRGALEEFVVIDVAPFTLGIETEGDKFSRIVPRNTAIPTTRKSMYRTTVDNQTEALIHVLQGENDKASSNESLGGFSLGGISSALRGESLVEVAFEYDVNGIVKITAKDRKTGLSKSITIKASKKRLSTDEVAHAQRDVSRHTGSMLAQRERSKVLFEGENTLKELTHLIRSAEKGEKKLDPIEIGRLSETAGKLKDALKSEDLNKLEEVIEKATGLIADYSY